LQNFPQKQLNARDDTKQCKPNLRQFFKKVRQMASRRYFEQTATSIAALGRNELKRQIRNFRGRFKLDFTEDYLNTMSVERLRHILLSALVTAKPHN
jgi:hypothetical protein